MSRRDEERLADVIAAAEAIASHLDRGGLDDGLVFDAVRVRLIEIGEAVKDIDSEVLAEEPEIPGATSLGCETTSPTATSTPRARSCRPPWTMTCHRCSPLLDGYCTRWNQPPNRTTESRTCSHLLRIPQQGGVGSSRSVSGGIRLVPR